VERLPAASVVLVWARSLSRPERRAAARNRSENLTVNVRASPPLIV
jgi:hypothetical protein